MYLLKDLTREHRRKQIQTAISENNLFSNDVRRMVIAVENLYPDLHMEFQGDLEEIKSRFDFHLPGNDISKELEQLLEAGEPTREQMSAIANSQRAILPAYRIEDYLDWSGSREDSRSITNQLQRLYGTGQGDALRPAMLQLRQTKKYGNSKLEDVDAILDAWHTVFEEENEPAGGQRQGLSAKHALLEVLNRESSSLQIPGFLLRCWAVNGQYGLFVSFKVTARTVRYREYFVFLPNQVLDIDFESFVNGVGDLRRVGASSRHEDDELELFDPLTHLADKVLQRVEHHVDGFLQE